MTASSLNGCSAEVLAVSLSLTQVSMRKGCLDHTGLCGHNVPPADCGYSAVMKFNSWMTDSMQWPPLVALLRHFGDEQVSDARMSEAARKRWRYSKGLPRTT